MIGVATLARSSVACGAALLVAAASPAQSHLGSLRGTVLGPSAGPVADTPLRLVRDGTRETRTAASGPDGAFVFASLPVGSYRLEVELAGYKKYAQDVVVRVNEQRHVTVALELGALTEEVRVVAPALAIETRSGAVRTVIENRQIAGLPLDGRNFLELTLLVPGAVPSAPGSAGSVRGDFAFNANGAREDGNNFLLDGAVNVDPKLNTFAVRPPADAIEEFEVLTSTADASFGRAAGAHVNIVLKSGTNRLRGTAYDFFRNGALDARNFFAPRDRDAPEYGRHQFGASLGGPLARNRTFFFADYEGTRLREGITRVTNVPTAAERAGDFAQSLLGRPIDPFTQQPFPGGRIPASRINAIGAAIAALYPLPNRAAPFRNFVSSPPLRDRNDQFDLRIDHGFGDASNLVVRYSFGDRDLFEPFSGAGFAAIPGFGTNIPRRAQNLLVGNTHVFSSSLVNDARFGFTRVAAGAFHENSGRSLNRAVGLPDLAGASRDLGLSFITVSGFSPIGDEFNNPQHSTTNSFQLYESATLALGPHLLKVGGEARAIQQNGFRDVQSRGFLTFSDQVPITGNALADLLLGFPVLTGGALVDNQQRLRTESYGFFLQDSYGIAPTLTLSAGLRYEYNSPPVDVEDRANVYDTATRRLLRVGTQGIPRSGYRGDTNNWGPRIGLAWTPFGSATVLRGAYGVYYDQSPLAPGEGLYFNAPYWVLRLFFPLPGLPLTLRDPFPAAFPPLPQTALTFDRNLRTPIMQHWNVNVQRALGGSRLLEIGYVGSKGSNLWSGRDINQPRPSPLQPNPRPVPQFDDIIQLESRASSRYDSLQVKLQQRIDRGLSFLTSYTWSTSKDDASGFFASAGDPNFPQDSLNPEAERGRSNFDVRHRLSISFSYDVPFRDVAGAAGRGWASRLLAGWSVHGIVTLQPGRPFTVALPREFDNSNTGRANLGFGANDRPDLVGDPALSNPTPDHWFNTAAFAVPPSGTFGNAGRNIVEGPGYQNVSLALIKDVRLTGAASLQVRGEVFNLFNHANFDLPDNFFGSPTFGRILSAGSPRRIQLGAKLIF